MMKLSVDPGTKRSKTANIVSAGPKWEWSEREYLHYGWTYDTNIWMSGVEGGYLSPCKGFNFFVLDQFKNFIKNG